jgi:hypothetical protein
VEKVLVPPAEYDAAGELATLARARWAPGEPKAAAPSRGKKKKKGKVNSTPDGTRTSLV